jgi:hypothetical protein
VIVDLKTDRVRSAPLGGPYVTGEMLWLSPKRVVFAPSHSLDRIRLYSPSASLVARGEQLGAFDAALVDDRLLALNGPFLIEASPPTGRLRDLARLPSPILYAIEPVVDGPSVAAPATSAALLARAHAT